MRTASCNLINNLFICTFVMQNKGYLQYVVLFTIQSRSGDWYAT